MYLAYAVRRFGLRDGFRRFAVFSVWPVLVLRGPRRAFRRWRRRDRRERARGHAGSKWAVNRDGDYGLVECPACHDQGVWFDREKRVFACRGGVGHRFRVHLEDGVVQLRDHRRGDIVHFPATAVYDDAGKAWRLGLADDAPWWWARKEVYRDLRPDGKDGHGHQAYELLPPEPAQAEQAARPESGSGAIP
jgi:hypothetical protein